MARKRKTREPARPRPHWDSELRELTFRGRLVHHFRRPAAVAEAILTTFEEEGWPRRIDDPLPPLDERRESVRLRKEIYAFNRRLKNPLIRFFMDGTGQGICWESTTHASIGEV